MHQPENTSTKLLNPWYDIITTTDDDDDDDDDDDGGDSNCDSGGKTSVNNKHAFLRTPGNKNG